jgi:hypothetical protein
LPIDFKELAQRFGEWDDLTPIIEIIFIKKIHNLGFFMSYAYHFLINTFGTPFILVVPINK